MNIDPKLISLRDLSEGDIPRVLDYWFRSPPEFIASMGVDLTKLPPESEMEKTLVERYRENQRAPSSRLHALAVVYSGQAVGMHTLHPLVEGDYGVFHAHIWNPELRKRGLCMLTYPQACLIFMRRFDLKRIVFKTPAQNTGAIRVKEKLGIRHIGQEIIGFSIIKDGTLAQVYELTRAEAEQLE